MGHDRRQRNSEIRTQVLAHYSPTPTPTCACCKTTDNLTIDHTDGNGNAHRKEVLGNAALGGSHFYRWLLANNYPPGYQVLCKPCNTSKGEGRWCRLPSHGHPRESVEILSTVKRYDAPVSVNGSTIYELRREAGLSLRDFEKAAIKIGDRISRATVSTAETYGHTSPHMLHVIASVLSAQLGRDIKVGDLLKKNPE
jgi:hypothetical protein